MYELVYWKIYNWNIAIVSDIFLTINMISNFYMFVKYVSNLFNCSNDGLSFSSLHYFLSKQLWDFEWIFDMFYTKLICFECISYRRTYQCINYIFLHKIQRKFSDNPKILPFVYQCMSKLSCQLARSCFSPLT